MSIFKSNKKRILLVDSLRPTRERNRSILESKGYKVIATESTGEAQKEIAKKPPDLIIADTELSGLGGIAFYKVLKKQPETAHIPFIFFTSMAKKEVEKILLRGDGYLAKAEDWQGLLQKVENALKAVETPTPPAALTSPAAPTSPVKALAKVRQKAKKSPGSAAPAPVTKEQEVKPKKAPAKRGSFKKPWPKSTLFEPLPPGQSTQGFTIPSHVPMELSKVQELLSVRFVSGPSPAEPLFDLSAERQKPPWRFIEEVVLLSEEAAVETREEPPASPILTQEEFEKEFEILEVSEEDEKVLSASNDTLVLPNLDSEPLLPTTDVEIILSAPQVSNDAIAEITSVNVARETILAQAEVAPEEEPLEMNPLVIVQPKIAVTKDLKAGFLAYVRDRLGGFNLDPFSRLAVLDQNLQLLYSNLGQELDLPRLKQVWLEFFYQLKNLLPTVGFACTTDYVLMEYQSEYLLLTNCPQKAIVPFLLTEEIADFSQLFVETDEEVITVPAAETIFILEPETKEEAVKPAEFSLKEARALAGQWLGEYKKESSVEVLDCFAYQPPASLDDPPTTLERGQMSFIIAGLFLQTLRQEGGCEYILFEDVAGQWVTYLAPPEKKRYLLAVSSSQTST